MNLDNTLPKTDTGCTYVHIVVGHSFGGSMKLVLADEAYAQTHRLIVLGEHYAVGPLRELDSPDGRDARRRWFTDNIAEGREAYEQFEEEYARLADQIGHIPQQAEVILWAGANASEQAGIRHALHLLRGKGNIVAVYNACAICEDLYNRPEAYIQYRHSGEIPPDKLRQSLLTLNGSGRLSLDERQVLEEEWRSLAERSGNLRIWLHGAVTEVPEDYFDGYLLEKLDSLRHPGDGRFLKAARLVGEALGYCEQNIPDYYFEYRLREMIYAGVLEIQGVPAAMRYYSIRQKPVITQDAGMGYRHEGAARRGPLLLRTPRLILKSGDDLEAKAVLDYFLRNKEFLEAWEVQRQPEFFTLAVQEQMLQEDKAHMDRGQLLKLWIIRADEPERIIGSVALSNIVRGAFQSCHLGYRLDGSEHGKGYMTEAVKEIIAYGFGKLGLHRIEANIMPRNHASLKVTEKLGFYHEGLAKKYLKINGEWEDHIHMVLVNEELE
ncbi:MAG: hypothetical protein K0Q90_2708 [Paenibacillaceae bacterium]|jgi:RimJ/RimL family protein N-acetyltransferase|nr:hypothetical protein [Paenibacillaceae bacterium]